MIIRIKRYFSHLSQSYKTFKKDSKLEIEETKELTKLLWEYRKRKLTDKEVELVKGQSKDILRIAFMGSLFVIPGGSIFTFVLIKFGNKTGIEFVPSSFQKKKISNADNNEQNKVQDVQEF